MAIPDELNKLKKTGNFVPIRCKNFFFVSTYQLPVTILIEVKSRKHELLTIGFTLCSKGTLFIVPHLYMLSFFITVNLSTR